MWWTAPLLTGSGKLSFTQEGCRESNIYHKCEYICLTTVYSICQGQCSCVFVCLLKRCMSIFFLVGGLWSRAPPQWRALTEPAPRTGQSCSERSGSLVRWALPPDSWGALIRACGWNCTGMRAADGPAEETGITVCDADTLLTLPLSSAADSICLSLESQKPKRSHKEQLQSCRSVRLRPAFDSVLWPGWE